MRCARLSAICVVALAACGAGFLCCWRRQCPSSAARSESLPREPRSKAPPAALIRCKVCGQQLVDGKPDVKCVSLSVPCGCLCSWSSGLATSCMSASSRVATHACKIRIACLQRHTSLSYAHRSTHSIEVRTASFAPLRAGSFLNELHPSSGTIATLLKFA
eukprot:6143556-Pleurochrysis_carterae.AAC.2